MFKDARTIDESVSICRLGTPGIVNAQASLQVKVDTLSGVLGSPEHTPKNGKHAARRRMLDWIRMGIRMCSRELPPEFEGGIVGRHAYGTQAAVLIFRVRSSTTCALSFFVVKNEAVIEPASLQEPSGYRYTFSKDDGQYILSDDASSSSSGRKRRAVLTGKPLGWRQSSSPIRLSFPQSNERAIFKLLSGDGSLILGCREYRLGH